MVVAKQHLAAFRLKVRVCLAESAEELKAFRIQPEKRPR